MILRTHNLPSESFKNDFVEFDEAKFQGVELPSEFIVSILGIVKMRFGRRRLSDVLRTEWP
jgi:hypothetical protein